MAAAKTTKLMPWVTGIFLTAAGVKALVSLYRIVTTTAPDFAYYYEAAGEVAQRVISPIHLLPPASLLVFAPLRLLPYDAAQAAWVTGSFLCLISIVWRMTGIVGIRAPSVRWTIAALAYLSFPTQFTLGMGQVNLIVLLLLVISVGEEMRHRSVFAGGLFTLAVLLKPEVALLAPVFLLTRRWMFVGSAVVNLIGFTFVSLFVFGLDAYSQYLGRMQMTLGSWRDMGIYYNQGISGLVARTGFGGSQLYIALSILIVAVTLFVAIRRRIGFPSAVWIAFPVILLIEPIAWQHHFVFLLPVYVVLWSRVPSLKGKLFLGLSPLLISMNFASPGFLDTMPLGWLVSSHATIGTLLLWVTALLFI